MKVYGLSFDHTTNYGSCFQAYALQTVIEGIRTGQEACSYELIPVCTFPRKKGQKRSAKDRLRQYIERYYRSPFEAFEKKYMHFAPVSSAQELDRLNEDGDAFVCGSDVIWNPEFGGGGLFFLNFAKKYRFSYAASFGKPEIGESVLESVRRYLPEFQAISVREQSGADAIRKCIGRDAFVAVDPVLLLDRSFWEKTALPPRGNGKHILVYTTGQVNVLDQFVKKLKSITGLPVVFSTFTPFQAVRHGLLRMQGPEEWLQLLRDAEYVISTSFHATAFSVLFHKKFFTMVNGEKEKGINMRMHSFLKNIGLDQRVISDLPDQIDLQEPDFTQADLWIAQQREASMEFLRNCLNEAYRQKSDAAG